MNTKNAFVTASSFYQKGQYTRALETLNELLNVDRSPKTYALLAKTLVKLGFRSDAASAYELAGRQKPQRDDYLREALLLHGDCGNDDQALALGSLILPLAFKDPDLAFVLSRIFLSRQQKELLAGFKTVLVEGPELKHRQMAAKLLTDDLYDEGNRHIVATLFKKHPENVIFRALYLIFAREVSDLAAVEKHMAPITASLAQGKLDHIIPDNPFFHLHWCGDEAINKLVIHDTDPLPADHAETRRKLPHTWGSKIRIGYLSSDFWPGHATMKLLQRVLELHDKDRFEITLFDHSEPSHQSEEVFDYSQLGTTVDIRGLSNQAAAEAIRARGIDVLVDLKGHTRGSRAYILNHMPAPIQVAWLGFPGTTVNIDLDYIIGDHYVLPDASKAHFYEKYCRLPECYQPNDPFNRPKPRPTTRAQYGLPEDAFVYASFNGNRKITPQMVDVWCNILKRSKNSVLWLLCNGPRAEANIWSRLEARGINRKRVVFTARIRYEDHIDRQQLADLGLDTFPVNGHTTTSEQLWGGLPVLTVKGNNFASRVSESLLNAIGLPELVADDIKAYEDMAVQLAGQPERIAQFKETLAANRYIKPLFDAERFTHHLETAFEMMAERARQGLTPEHMDVPALPVRSQPFMEEDRNSAAIAAE
ncbi:MULTISPECIES: glycosyl transferase [unclassified Rhizobium]|uniref:O-linked N-acetylglucosamine transferase, SPINDLY family protein n=1 Tax=unclassified Rhizobium TaxID=2613769 RepID=UPI0006479D2A|nr:MULTISPECIES: glycosyl transferase [unclassified Rhizobium]MBN8950179.1 glycosyl transferase [Rhizobium tropici]OJY62471.1 MAG: glycosyl transferase [Rhizobium sp. 60-20]RKD74525.1 glycosyl transferase family 41 [Rhizobium sp. WW_1]